MWENGTWLQGGRYQVIRFLGGGGFGITYRAQFYPLASLNLANSPKLDVVLKTPHSLNQAEQFIQEAQILAQLTADYHPAIVRLLDFFVEDGMPCLVMELIHGDKLSALVEQFGALPETDAIQCLRQVGTAVAQMHAAGFLHHDIKPENIIRRRNGSVVLIDFGSAVPLTSLPSDPDSPQPTARNSYTNYYASSEQINGVRHPTNDVYALAATLYYLVTGELPESATAQGTLGKPLKLPAHLSPKLIHAIRKGMAQELNQRSKSVSDWLKLLPEAQSPITATARTPFQLQSLFPRRSSAALSLPTIELASERNIDYAPLEQLLQHGNWRDADRETTKLLLTLFDREAEGWISAGELAKLPCRDLTTLDQLWKGYSKGRFGFSVQQEIWARLGGSFDASLAVWRRFAEQVGWFAKPSRWEHLLESLRLYQISEDRRNGYYYGSFNFNLRARAGHLPTAIHPAAGILLGRLEPQHLIDLQEDRVQLRQKTASAIAAHKRVQRQQQQILNDADLWQQRADLARHKGDEALAQEALQRKQNQLIGANTLQPSLDQQAMQIEQYKAELTMMDTKVTQAETSLWTIEFLSARLKACKRS